MHIPRSEGMTLVTGSSASVSPSPRTVNTDSLILSVSGRPDANSGIDNVAQSLSQAIDNFNPSKRNEILQLCGILASLIDKFCTQNEFPAVAHSLPSLIKEWIRQVYQMKNEVHLQSAIMMLYLSIKNACHKGWFLDTDANEILNLGNEMLKFFYGCECISIEQSKALDIISKIVPRFLPNMKVGHILVSFEAKSGYSFLVDGFLISNDLKPAANEKLHLVVVQTDNIESSSCLVTPPQANFLLNGKGVARRNNLSLDNGPQLPTDVTTMLMFGLNLIQAIGYFNGNYLIAIAFMSVVACPDDATLPDYIYPVSTTVAVGDSEVIEGSSRISVNCPISFKRIKIPVKGHNCRHHQCFDYDNYKEINFRKPSWRCPHCNQPVNFTELRVDQRMIKILKEADDVTDVIISADGSWKVVPEQDGNENQVQGNSLKGEQDDLAGYSSTKNSNVGDGMVDLTMEEAGEGENDVTVEYTARKSSMNYENLVCANTCGTVDRKPFQAHQGCYGALDTSEVPYVNNVSERFVESSPHQIDNTRLETLLPSTSRYLSVAAVDSQSFHISEFSPTSNITTAPVLTDPITPALNRGGSENEILRLSTSIPRNIRRDPVAVQALPAQIHVTASQQRPWPSTIASNSMGGSCGPILSSQVTSSTLTNTQETNMGHTDTGRHLFRGFTNSPILDTNSSIPQGNSNILNSDGQQDLHHASRQAFQPSATRQLSARMLSNFPRLTSPMGHWDLESLQRFHSTHSRISQAACQSAFLGQQAEQGMTQSGRTFRDQVRLMMPQRVPHTPRPSLPLTMDAIRSTTRDLRRYPTETPMSDHSLESSEQNWQPAGRMRGSLVGRAYSEALSHYIVPSVIPVNSITSMPMTSPSNYVVTSTPLPISSTARTNPLVAVPTSSSGDQLSVLIANNRIAQTASTQASLDDWRPSQAHS